VVTDLNTRFLDGLGLSNVEVRRHDIAAEPLAEGMFDLVHARLVLMHVPSAPAVLEQMVRALKPQGWLVVEEFEVAPLAMTSLGSADVSNLNTTFALRHVMEQAGMDLRFGRRLPHLFESQGLVDIDAEGRMCLWRGRSAGSDLLRANYQAFRSRILETLLVTPQEFDRDMRNLDDPRFATSSPVMWTVGGRRLGGAALGACNLSDGSGVIEV
jgi:SAM-dependent methyltransferase